jgi:adenine-specific DNA-methyltransferase
MERLIAAGRVSAPSNTPNYVFFADDFPMSQLDNVWSDTQGASDRTYVVQTSTKVVERCMLMATDPGDLVLDPTCGAGTTAFVAEQWGRRWITIDTSRVALALARTRLMSARYPYYLLADTEDGATASAKAVGAAAPSGMTYGSDVRKGFVYRQIPHVTLGSVAQNPEVKPGMNRSEINEAIVRNADLEVLVDSPIEDRKRVRVSGRFTVEGLSPHRTLEDNTPSESKESTAPGFEATILDNLRRAGIQNTYKGERLKFDRLDPWAGTWLQAEGAFTDADGVARRVAVAIGPEHGTVSPDLVKDAAREALRGQGFDLLIVLGFAFDARASETTKEFEPASDGFTVAADERTMGRLRVLLARMNNDLAMGDEFLKKTGSGNLFMVFGEPDVDIRPLGDGNIEVEVRGVDVYDPTTGVVRSASTSDIACWFIDTNYDEQSFFVRHAYFTGDKEPFKKLKQALRSEISEDAWLSLYSTTSRPFAAPTTGKIAVKVINHYGDEVMQVYEL